MFKTILFVTLVVIGIGLLALAWNYWRFDKSISALNASLAQKALPSPQTAITPEMLAGLPEPAQRFFNQAGVIGQKIPRLVHLKQVGRIRASTNDDWMRFEAVETYATNPPGFVWRVWFPTRNLPIAMGRDFYLDGNASIHMKMLSSFTLADERGPELGAAGLMRYLNEMMWFPTAYLSQNLTIAPAGKNEFSVKITDRGVDAVAIISVDAQGRMENFTAQRFNTETAKLEKWQTPMTDYGNFAGLNVPVKGSAQWLLDVSAFTYIELEITEIDYTY